MTSSKDNANDAKEPAIEQADALAEGAHGEPAGARKGAKPPRPALRPPLPSPKSSSPGGKTPPRNPEAKNAGPGARRGISLPIPKPRRSPKMGEAKKNALKKSTLKKSGLKKSGATRDKDEVEELDPEVLEVIDVDIPKTQEFEVEALEVEDLEVEDLEVEELHESYVEAPETDRMAAEDAAEILGPATGRMSAQIFEQDFKAKRDAQPNEPPMDPPTIPLSPQLFEEDFEDEQVQQGAAQEQKASEEDSQADDDFEAEATVVSESPLLEQRLDADRHAPAPEAAPATRQEAPVGDFEGEKTEVFDSPFEHEVLSARLTTLSGPNMGQEFLLNHERNTLGRGQNNTIVLGDIAMSRQHFEIRQDAEQHYLLIDLQSANGTRLNHTLVEEAELRHGDRVEAGRSEFQFVQPGNRVPARSQQRHIIVKRETKQPQIAPPVPAAAPPGERRLENALTWIIRGASVLSVLLGATMVVLYLNPPEQAAVAPEVSEPSAEAPREHALYLEGVEKVKDRDWEAASALFKQVESIDPGFARVEAQLARVEEEQRVSAQLDEARELLVRNDYAGAAAIASKVTNRSVYIEDAHRLLREAKQYRVAARLQQAQQALSAQNLDQAKAHIEAVLDEVPNHQGALELQAILEGDAEKFAEKIAAMEKKEAQEQARRKAASRRPAGAAPKIDWFAKKEPSKDLFAKGEPKEAVQINFTRGFSLYRAGKLSKASSYFRDAAGSDTGALARRATQTADQIDAFGLVRARANRALEAKDWAKAAKELKSAHRADRKVASSAYFEGSINADLATAYAKMGLEAAAASDFKRASQHYKKSYRLQSSNAAVRALSRELSRRGNTLYIQAASKRKKDPAGALKLCQEIVSILAPHHELYGKAEAMMAELK